MKESDNKYHLFCVVCGRSNPFIQVHKTTGFSIFSIACRNNCAPGHSINQICVIMDIKDLAKEYAEPGEVNQAIRDVCESLGLNSMELFSV